MRTFFILMVSIVVSVMATVVIIEQADAGRLDLPFTHKSTRIYTPAKQVPLA
jgi:hypothetical protein